MFKKRTIGFTHAWNGIIHAFSNHPNFYFHLSIGSMALAVGYVLEVSRIEQLLLLTLFVLGVVVEMVNTAIESVVDLVTEEWRKNAKIAKDVASGAMLVYAIGSAIVALSILLPAFAHRFL